MSTNGYATYACLLIINYTMFNALPILALLIQAEKGNIRAVIAIGVLLMGSAFASVCLVWVTTMFCFINYPEPIHILDRHKVPAPSHE